MLEFTVVMKGTDQDKDGRLRHFFKLKLDGTDEVITYDTGHPDRWKIGQVILFLEEH